MLKIQKSMTLYISTFYQHIWGFLIIWKLFQRKWQYSGIWDKQMPSEIIKGSLKMANMKFWITTLNKFAFSTLNTAVGSVVSHYSAHDRIEKKNKLRFLSTTKKRNGVSQSPLIKCTMRIFFKFLNHTNQCLETVNRILI